MKSIIFNASNKIKVGMLASTLLLLVSNPVNATCSTDSYLGSICITAANFCPSDFSPAEGQILFIGNYEALFAVIGCTYGGNCQTTFALPDLRGRAAIGAGTGLGLSMVRLGDKIGSQFQTLMKEQMPSHSHVAVASEAQVDIKAVAYDGKGVSATPSSTNNALQAVAKNALSLNDEAKVYGSGNGNIIPLQSIFASIGASSVAVSNAGLGQKFAIQDPSIALTHCISVNGLFPPRP